MAHELFDGRYVGREAAWHGLGVVIDTPMTADQAVDLARLDYEVAKLPMTIELPNGQQIVSDQYALTRMPTEDDNAHRVFGTVSESYQVLQNREVFHALNPLSDIWQVETAGAIEQGKRAFMSLAAGEYEIKGRSGRGSDLINMFFLVINDFQGSIKIRFTPVRVVCKNTLTLSDSQYSVNASVTHKGGTVAMEYKATLALIAKMQGVQGQAMEILEKLSSTIIDDDEAELIFQAAFPLPKKARKLDLFNPADMQDDMLSIALQDVAFRHDYNTERISKHHVELKELYNWYNDNHTDTANTAYQAYNVVTDYLDHVQSGGGRAESTVFGLRAAAKARAFKTAANLYQN